MQASLRRIIRWRRTPRQPFLLGLSTTSRRRSSRLSILRGLTRRGSLIVDDCYKAPQQTSGSGRAVFWFEALDCASEGGSQRCPVWVNGGEYNEGHLDS